MSLKKKLLIMCLSLTMICCLGYWGIKAAVNIDSKKDLTEGDIVTFGSYEQDCNSSNGAEPIEWIVLSVEGDKALLMSKYCLDSRPYNDENKAVTWENSSLRKWLNNEFYNTAFTDSEKERIPDTVNINNDSEWGIDGGNDTTDKVFLFSLDEVLYNTHYDYYRLAPASFYALKQGAWTIPEEYEDDDEYEYKNTCYWWLRTPGENASQAALVAEDGSVYAEGDNVNEKGNGVRPVIYITLKNDTSEVKGDINGDGEISSKDVTQLRRYLAGGWNVEIDLSEADLNDDDEVNAKDVTVLRRYLAGGWGVTLPAKNSSESTKTVIDQDGNTNVITTEQYGVRTRIYNPDGKLLLMIWENRNGYRSENYYDDKGNLKISKSYSSDGGEGVREYEYDSEGRCISEKYNYSGPNYSNSDEYKYEYDDSGVQIKYIYIGSNGYIYEQYNDSTSGKQKKYVIKRLNKDGSYFVSREVNYEFDDKYRVIKEIDTYYSNGTSTTSTYEYEYNKYGTKTKTVVTTPEGKKGYVEELFNESGKRIDEIKLTDLDGNVYEYPFVYDENGKCLKYAYYYNVSYETNKPNCFVHECINGESGHVEVDTLYNFGLFIWKYEYKYDDSGNQIWYRYTSSDGVTTARELDENGDWVEEVHNWIETDRKEATDTENGYAKYKCSKCDETKTVTLYVHSDTDAGMYYEDDGIETFVPWSKLLEDGIVTVEDNVITQIDSERAQGNLKIENGITKLDADACWHSKLKSVYIPESLTEGARFRYWYDLEEIVVDLNNPVYDSRDNCNAIIETATNTLVAGCKGTTFPSTVTTIGNSAFMSSGIERITIPETIKKIGEWAFEDSRLLVNLVLSEGLEYIGSMAFSSNYDLTEVIIPATVTYIGDNAFSYCDELKSVSVSSGNKNYDSRENCNAIIETSTGRLIAGCVNTVIPDGTKIIQSGSLISAFSKTDLYELDSIVIPVSVESIENYGINNIDFQYITFLGAPPTIGDKNFLVWDYKEYYYKPIPDLVKISVPAQYINEYKELLPQYADKIEADS